MKSDMRVDGAKVQLLTFFECYNHYSKNVLHIALKWQRIDRNSSLYWGIWSHRLYKL